MNEFRRLGWHGLLLLVAALAAFVKSQPEDASSRPLDPGEVELWSGKPADVGRIRFESKRQIVTLERQKDEHGSFYRGSVEAVEQPPEEPTAPDAGPPKRRPKPVQAGAFVSVSSAEKVAEKLASLRAKRAIGEVGADRAEAFGLDEPEGTLVVEVGNTKHTLVVGRRTHGASVRYVRDQVSNQVYAVDGSIVSDISGGAPRLAERSLHEWRVGEVQSAAIKVGEEQRSLVRGGSEGARFWADAARPEAKDETVANWLGKVDRIRPVKFVDELPEGATALLRVDYKGKSGALGFIELHQATVDGKPTYYVRSERLRMHASVSKTMAEQVRDDVASVLPNAVQPESSASAAGSAAAPSAAPAPPAPSASAAPRPTLPPGHP